MPPPHCGFPGEAAGDSSMPPHRPLVSSSSGCTASDIPKGSSGPWCALPSRGPPASQTPAAAAQPTPAFRLSLKKLKELRGGVARFEFSKDPLRGQGGWLSRACPQGRQPEFDPWELPCGREKQTVLQTGLCHPHVCRQCDKPPYR